MRRLTGVPAEENLLGVSLLGVAWSLEIMLILSAAYGLGTGGWVHPDVVLVAAWGFLWLVFFSLVTRRRFVKKESGRAPTGVRK